MEGGLRLVCLRENFDGLNVRAGLQSVKFSSNLKFIGLLDNAGLLTVYSFLNPNCPQRVGEVYGVLGFEWYEGGNNQEVKLATTSEKAITLTSMNDLSLSKDANISVNFRDICVMSCDDIRRSLTDLDYFVDTNVAVQILSFKDGLCTIIYGRHVVQLILKNEATVQFGLIFEVDIDVTNAKNVQLVNTLLFTISAAGNFIHIYSISTGILIKRLSTWNNSNDPSLNAATVPIMSVSPDASFLVLYRDCRAYYISLEQVIPWSSVHGSSSRRRSRCSPFGSKDDRSGTDLASTIDDRRQPRRSDSVSTLGSGSSAFTADRTRAGSSFNHDVWPAPRAPAKRRGVGPTGFGGNGRHPKPPERYELNIPGSERARKIATGPTTFLLWTEPDGSEFGGLTVVDVVTNAVVARTRFDQPSYVLFGRTQGHPHLVLADSRISACQYGVAQEEVVSRFMMYENASLADYLAKLNHWECISMPLGVLESSLKNHQLDAISFFLKSQDDVFSAKHDSKNMRADFQHLQKELELLTGAMKTSLQELGSKSFGDQLLQITLTYLNNILKNIAAIKSVQLEGGGFESDLVDQIFLLVMTHVVELRSYLKMYQSVAATSSTVDVRGRLSPGLGKWQTMDREAVLRDAIWNRRLPAAFQFLSATGTGEQLLPESTAVGLDWSVEFLLAGDIAEARNVLLNLGLDDGEKIRELCFRTRDRALRRSLCEELTTKSFLKPEETTAVEFLRSLEGIYACQSFARAHEQFLSRRNWSDRELAVLSDVWEPFFDRCSTTLTCGEHGPWEMDNWENYEYCCLTLSWVAGWTAEDRQRILLEAMSVSLNELPVGDDGLAFVLQRGGRMDLSRWVDTVSDRRTLASLADLVRGHVAPFIADELSDRLAVKETYRVDELEDFTLLLRRHGRRHAATGVRERLLADDEFQKRFVQFCLENRLFHVLYQHLDSFRCLPDVSPNSASSSWLSMLTEFHRWGERLSDPDALLRASCANASYKLKMDDVSVESLFANGHVILAMATILFSDVSVDQSLRDPADVDNKFYQVRWETIQKVAEQSAGLISLLQPFVRSEKMNFPRQVITVYDLLREGIIFDVCGLFGWQPSNQLGPSASFPEMPFFSNMDLVKSNGTLQELDFSYYLKQGRPFFAYIKFVADCNLEFGTVTLEHIKEACNRSHSIAIQHFHSPAVSSACVALMEMLNYNTRGLRIDLEAAQQILARRNRGAETVTPARKREDIELANQEEVGFLLSNTACGQKGVAQEMLLLLEEALLDRLRSDDIGGTTIEAMLHWNRIIGFCRRHELPPSTTFLKLCARANDWVMFVLFAELHRFPKLQVLQSAAEFQSSHLTHYITNAFSQVRYRTISESKIAGKKAQAGRRGKSRDVRANFYAKFGDAKLINTGKKAGSAAETEPGSEEEASGNTSDDLTDDSTTSSIFGYDTDSKSSNDDIPSDLLAIILHCHTAEYPWRSLLDCAFQLKNAVLAVLAACYEDAVVSECLCVWLTTSVDLPARRNSGETTSWSDVDLAALYRDVIRKGQLILLTVGFNYFLPESALYSLVQFLKDFTVHKSYTASVAYLKEFVLLAKNLPEAEEESQRILDTAVIIMIEVLVGLTSNYECVRLLQVLTDCGIDDVPLNRDEVPDYSSLADILRLLTGLDVPFSLRSLLEKPNQAVHHDHNFRIILTLIQRKEFPGALQFATFSGIPKSTVVTAQMNEELAVRHSLGREMSLEARLMFWKRCYSVFRENDISDFEICHFFREYGFQMDNQCEKYLLLDLAWHLAKRVHGDSEVDELELEMWLSKVRAQVQFEDEGRVLKKAVAELHHLADISESKDRRTARAVLHSNASVAAGTTRIKLDLAELVALDQIIGQELDDGNVDKAYRLTLLFDHRCLSFKIILNCMMVAEGVKALHGIDAEMRMLLDGKAPRRRTLSVKSLSRSASRTSENANVSIGSDGPHPGQLTDSVGSVTDQPAGRLQADVLEAMEKLMAHCEVGLLCCSRILVLSRIAEVLGVNYVDLIQDWDELVVLKRLLQCGNVDRFLLAKEYIVSNNMKDSVISEFLCNNIVRAFRVFTGNESLDASFKDCNELIIKPTDAPSVFVLLAKLCDDPSLLGRELLEVSEIVSVGNICLSLEVELVVHAHTCFTVGFHIEGITRSLKKARKLINILTAAEKYPLMVKLFTGIGRFSEMSYVFDILQENYQFELLLGKGMEKIPDLKVALLDYTRRRHPVDTETFSMIALRFSMFREIAEMLEAVAKQEIDALRLDNACTQHKPNTMNKLESILELFVDAAESYTKADYIQHALYCAKQAELIALQIHLKPSCVNILKMDSGEVSDFIVHHKFFLEAHIVAVAYGHDETWSVWSLALYNNFVMKNDTSYMKDFSNRISSISAVVEEVARRYQKESNKSSKATANVKYLLDFVDDVRVRHDLADSLGFTDFVMQMLRGKSANLLQDITIRKYKVSQQS